MRHVARTSLLLLSCLGAMGVACAQSEGPPNPAEQDAWIDRVRNEIHDITWRSTMHVDHLFGAQYGESVYQQGVSGSIAPVLLWDEFNRFTPRLKFNVQLPLPQLNERYRAFLGRINREELVTERGEQSSSYRRQFGPTPDEQTIFGISYRAPAKQGWRFDGGAGVRLRFPLDPYVKGGYSYQRGAVEDTLFTFRQTGFWQESEGVGTTSRIDLERMFSGPWLLRWTGSGTISQESMGLRGYSSITALRGYPGRKAIGIAIGFNGETDAEVPLQDYGIKVAWRKSIVRDWLVLELRGSLDYPRETLEQQRHPSWGAGIGFEMFFGTDEFLARPVTF